LQGLNKLFRGFHGILRIIHLARFHAREGKEDAVASAIKDVSAATMAERGCLEYGAFR